MKTVSFILLLFMGLLSCKRIKDKATDAGNKAKEKAGEAIDDLLTYGDPYQADVKENKKMFSDFFGFQPAEDVTNLYGYSNQIGIDAKYQMAFNCDTGTLGKIITNKALAIPGKSDGYKFEQLLNATAFPWWNDSAISRITPVMKNEDDRVFTYLWYDSLNHKAYFFSYDM